jgi:hypothetical protein
MYRYVRVRKKVSTGIQLRWSWVRCLKEENTYLPCADILAKELLMTFYHEKLICWDHRLVITRHMQCVFPYHAFGSTISILIDASRQNNEVAIRVRFYVSSAFSSLEKQILP